MLISEYEKISRSTAIYQQPFIYPVLGLLGEFGELMDKVLPIEFGAFDKSDIVKEIGDLLWYVTNITLDLGFSLHDVTDIVTGGIRADTFEEASAMSFGRVDERSPYLRIPVYAGQLAEIAKKSIRDHGGEISFEKKMICHYILAQIVLAYFDICRKVSVCPNEVAKINAEKLTSRAKRGKIKGEGDDR